MGLATVYGIIKQSGGYITVESEPSRGTTFRVYLPRVEQAPFTSPITRSLKVVRGKERVLLVEDDPAVRRLILKMLRENGYVVTEAKNPEEALLLCPGPDAMPLELLVTDIIMPGMNGRELAHRLLEAYPALRVLLLSGYTSDSALRQGSLEAGMAFLQKPFAADDLFRKIQKLLYLPPPAGENPS